MRLLGSLKTDHKKVIKTAKHDRLPALWEEGHHEQMNKQATCK